MMWFILGIQLALVGTLVYLLWMERASVSSVPYDGTETWVTTLTDGQTLEMIGPVDRDAEAYQDYLSMPS
jgi:hypothetical protein